MKSWVPLLVLCCLPSSAQDSNVASRFLRDYASDQKRIWTAPLHMNKRQFWTIAVPLAAGTVGLKSLDRRITNGLPNTPDQLDWSRRVSLAGSAIGLSAAVGGTTGAGLAVGKPTVSGMGRDALLSLASSMTMTYAIKGVFWRERPDRPGSRGSLWSGGDSFPSGHAMTSFAVATAVAHHPRCPRWLGIALYSTAVAISVSRISANRHWASDVYFGSISGILIGRSVARAASFR